MEDEPAAESSGYANHTAALPPAEREAVVARVIEERDYDEIAAAAGATPAAVRQRVSRGLAKRCASVDAMQSPPSRER